MKNEHDVPQAVREIAQGLAQPRPMRRGSISVRYLRCHKPGCACAADPEKRHGPYISVVRTVGGKTRSRWTSPDQAEKLRQQVEAGKNFRRQIEEYWRVCEEWADSELDAQTAHPDGAAEKKGSPRRWPRR